MPNRTFLHLCCYYKKYITTYIKDSEVGEESVSNAATVSSQPPL